MGRFQVYEERTGKYLGYFKQKIDYANVVVDVGCGTGAFSKIFIFLLDISKKLKWV